MHDAPRRFLTRGLLALALAALLVALAAAPASARWPYLLVGTGCLVALGDGFLGMIALLRGPRARRQGDLLQVCALWLVTTLAYLTLLNTAAELAVPGTFEWRSGPASGLDVAYVTMLTFASSGYGDVLPGNALGKGLSMLTSLSGLLYATLLCSAILQHFTPEVHE